MRALAWTLRIVLFLALFLFALKNTDTVSLRLYFDRVWQAPLILVVDDHDINRRTLRGMLEAFGARSNAEMQSHVRLDLAHEVLQALGSGRPFRRQNIGDERMALKRPLGCGTQPRHQKRAGIVWDSGEWPEPGQQDCRLAHLHDGRE